ncbi:hypothetical protein SDC9_78941 [bioreactor metagenome]|uniref:Uncharacterized protein n=1 Tax=bioreactor metagenome TaxID=1076179 RepID=A0A644YVM0_9ZZZZ
MRTDDGSHAVDHNLTVEMRESRFHHARHFFCVLHAAGVGNKALSAVSKAVPGMGFHPFDHFLHDLLF